MRSDAAALKPVGLIYEAAADMAAWGEALAAVAAPLRASAMSLTIVDRLGGGPVVVAPRTDPVWLDTFRVRWAAANPVREHGLRFPTGVVYPLERLMPQGELERSSFYNEYLEPQDLHQGLFANLAKSADAVAGIGFYRSRRSRDFGDDEVRRLTALLPHLERAVALNLRLRRLEAERDGIAAALDRADYGALLLDAAGRITFANAAAENLLRSGAALSLRSGRRATVGRSASALRALIGAGGGSVVLLCADGTRVPATVLPLPDRASLQAGQGRVLVTLKPRPVRGLPSRRQLRLLFGLTRAQAALAREVLAGDGIPAAARRLGVSPATARTHLLEIFQKTGTSHQAELVRVILQHTLPEDAAP